VPDNNRVAVRPSSVDELADAMRAAAADRATVGIRGAGTKATWGGVGSDPDVVVDTTAMNAVVEHAAGDLVVTVQAGTPLAGLQHHLAGARQWLALDPPEPAATVGGVVATTAGGPHRLRFGTPRDLLIGITVVLADGTVARSGGKVVKNVAGYDLGKLFTGSFGTLGVIAECTFRLHPVSPVVRVVSFATSAPASPVRDLLRSHLVPSAIEWDGDALHVVIESTEAGAAAQAEQAAAILGGGDVGERLPDGFGERPWREGDVGIKVTHRLSAFGPVVNLLAAIPDAAVSAHAGSGVAYAGWRGQPVETSVVVDRLRDAVSAYDGTVIVVDAPREVKEVVDVWGPVRGLDVMRRIKEQFDPDARMSPGRFVGGI
jgi:glycolate oxidase FAD binding subunit